jgi:uncharacterized membrane protein SpoIIM required for sporulation
VAARIAIGAVILFFLAGLLEGFGRQTIIDTGERFTVAAITAACLIVYFFWPRRGSA